MCVEWTWFWFPRERGGQEGGRKYGGKEGGESGEMSLWLFYDNEREGYLFQTKMMSTHALYGRAEGRYDYSLREEERALGILYEATVLCLLCTVL